MFIKKQLLANVLMVALAITIGAGVIWVAQAEGIDTDCDPGEMVTYYADTDHDAYGDPNSSVDACSIPNNYVLNNLDCDDTNASNSPEGTEICDGEDNDCDAAIDEGVRITFYWDGDNDAYGINATTTEACEAPSGFADNYGDCNDSNEAINPGAVELCDGIDNDCSGEIDDDCVATSTFYRDADGDNYGDPAKATTSLEQPSGYVANNDDCDDDDASIHPGATEICDFVDNNCDGRIDEGLRKRFYLDSDNDTYGDPDTAISHCSAPENYVSDNQDCDDTDADVNPGVNEVCGDNIDNDCDGTVDEGCGGDITCYRDRDGDDFGDPNVTATGSACPSGYVANNDDCDDDDASIHPGATEICDFVDNNCDGRIDEGLRKRFYYDFDDDGYGNPNKATSSCSAPEDYVSNNDDCNDNDSDIHPGATEICDDIDNDCDGSVDEGLDCDNDNNCNNCNLCDCIKNCLNNCACNNDQSNDCDCDRDRNRNRNHDHDNNDWDDDEAGYKNHGQWVSSMAHYTNELKKEGKITGKEKGQLMKSAAKKNKD